MKAEDKSKLNDELGLGDEDIVDSADEQLSGDDEDLIENAKRGGGSLAADKYRKENAKLKQQLEDTQRRLREVKEMAKRAAKAKDKQMQKSNKELRTKINDYEVSLKENDEVTEHLHARIQVLEADGNKEKMKEITKKLAQVNKYILKAKELERKYADAKSHLDGTKAELKKRIDERDMLVEKYKKLKKKHKEAISSAAAAAQSTPESPMVSTMSSALNVTATSDTSTADIESRDEALRNMNGMLKERKQQFESIKSALDAEKEQHAKAKNNLKRLLEFKTKAAVKIKKAAETISALKKRDEQLRKRLKQANEKEAKTVVQTRIDTKAVVQLAGTIAESSEKRKQLLSKAKAGCSSLKSSLDGLKNMVSQFPSAALDLKPAILKALKAREKAASGATAQMLKNYKREVKLRRKYFNQLQELKGNIRVYCRVRPLIYRDKGSEVCVKFPKDADDMSMVVRNEEGQAVSYEFEQIFRLDSTQDKVFKEVSGLVTSVVDGYNVCIFAYGQTGSGKTYTMQGNKENPGIYYRAIQHLFDVCKERANVKFDVRLSLLEIYNDKIQDLISSKQDLDKKLVPRENRNGNIEVPGLTIRNIDTIEDVRKAMALGVKNRSVGETKMNKDSSRSHLILTIYCEGQDTMSRNSSFGKLHLIDLAGSERLSRSGATGQSKVEAQEINKSLSALGNCIAARANKKDHVPYRDSVLTRILQDSLAKNSKTLMFVQISPSISDYAESTNSLKFAARVKEVELGKATKSVKKRRSAKSPKKR